MGAFVWDKTPDAAFNELFDRHARAIFQSGRRIAYDRAEFAENYAKEHARWTDRTTDARERLHATVEETGPIGTIVLSHGVSYGVWLEIANQGRFSIIPETIDVVGPLVMRDLQRMMNLGLVTRG